MTGWEQAAKPVVSWALRFCFLLCQSKMVEQLGWFTLFVVLLVFHCTARLNGRVQGSVTKLQQQAKVMGIEEIIPRCSCPSLSCR